MMGGRREEEACGRLRPPAGGVDFDFDFEALHGRSLKPVAAGVAAVKRSADYIAALVVARLAQRARRGPRGLAWLRGAQTSSQDGASAVDTWSPRRRMMHEVIENLRAMQQSAPEPEVAEDMALMLYETATLVGGYRIEDPGEFGGLLGRLVRHAPEACDKL